MRVFPVDLRCLAVPVLALLAGCGLGYDSGFGDACVYFSRGCSPSDGYALPAEDECYVTCDGSGAACDAGTCTLAWIDPCAGGDCAACGGEAWLCM